MKTQRISHTLGTLLLALCACGTSSSGGSDPDGGNAGASAAGASGGGAGGSSGSAGSAGSAGNGGRSGDSGNAGSAGSGAAPGMDASIDASIPIDSGGEAGTGGGDVGGANVFYFGHSLVGHDMPQMIGAFARARGKAYSVHGQIGFGTAIQSHWRWQGSFDSGFVPVGFADELPGSLLFDVAGHAALASGQYDVIVLTESNGFVSGTGTPGAWNEFCVEGEEFGGCSIEMAANLVREARMHNGAVRTLLYTNWKGLDEVGGMENWVPDIEGNVGWWENVADKTEAILNGEGATGSEIRVVPAALIVARIVTQARNGELAAYGINDQAPLFVDNVHLTRLGFYIIALTHYAAIFRDSPVGLPAIVDVASGDKSSLDMNGFELDEGLATHFQNVVWEELQAYPRSGVND